MSQITIYLPDAIEAVIRREAKRARVSVSAYIARLASQKTGAKGWPKGFEKLSGSWLGPLPVTEDPPPAEVEPM
jgi:hypothetical protein